MPNPPRMVLRYVSYGIGAFCSSVVGCVCVSRRVLLNGEGSPWVHIFENAFLSNVVTSAQTDVSQ